MKNKKGPTLLTRIGPSIWMDYAKKENKNSDKSKWFFRPFWV